MPDQKKEKAAGQLNDIDRLSDLSDDILHLIISFLGTKETCRTTILSKRWVHLWSTGFILNFKPSLFGDKFLERRETSDTFYSFIETTMQRYADQNLPIRTIKFKCQNVDTDIMGRIDRWLQIVGEKKVEELKLRIVEPCMTTDVLPSYKLPMILFSAKSLISLKCWWCRMPPCPSVTLISLQSLNLSYVNIDEHVLQHIIMFSPLKKLWLEDCTGITNISIPRCRKIELLHVDRTIPSGGSINVETSSIKHVSYLGFSEYDFWWPFKFSLALKKNLSSLNISYMHILDNVLDKLVTELSSIKIMSLICCKLPKNIRVSSLTLEELEVFIIDDLVNITVDAPVLKTCHYSSYLPHSSVISSRCNPSLILNRCDLDNQSLVRINRLLSGSKCFKVLSIDLSYAQVIFNMDELRKIDSTPYEVEKLSLSCSTPFIALSEKYFLIALLEGLFWSCRPTLLSLSITLAFGNRDVTVALLQEILQEKVKCWKHPLKRIETDGTVLSSTAIDFQLRMFW